MTAGSIGSEGTTWFFEFKPLWLFRIMNGYNLTVSAASALALMALLYFAAKRGVLTARAGRDLARDRLCTALSCDPVEAARHLVCRPPRDPRGGFDPSGLLLAVAAQPTMDNCCAHRCHRHHPRQSGRRICGLAVLPHGLCGHHRVVPQDRPRFVGARWGQRRGRRPAVQRPYAVSDGLCSDVGGALRQRLCAERSHRKRASSRCRRAPPSAVSTSPMAGQC